MDRIILYFNSLDIWYFLVDGGIWVNGSRECSGRIFWCHFSVLLILPHSMWDGYFWHIWFMQSKWLVHPQPFMDVCLVVVVTDLRCWGYKRLLWITLFGFSLRVCHDNVQWILPFYQLFCLSFCGPILCMFSTFMSGFSLIRTTNSIFSFNILIPLLLFFQGELPVLRSNR